MENEESLRRIDEARERQGWSDRRACLAAGLTEDFIRNLRRYPERSVKAHKLVALARALDVPLSYLIEEEAGHKTIGRVKWVLPVPIARENRMSEERVTLELLGARVMALTAEVRDLEIRFGALESRFSAFESRFSALETTINSRLGALEARFAAQEERMNRLISLVVRVAERIETPRG